MRFRSKLEESVAHQLDLYGVEWQYEEHTLDFLQPVKNGQCLCCKRADSVYKASRYTPDFFLPEFNVYIEVKGMMDSVYRTRMAAMLKHYYYKLDLYWVLNHDMPLVANRKYKRERVGEPKRYSDWIRSQGLEHCVKVIPPEVVQNWREKANVRPRLVRPGHQSYFKSEG